MIAGHLLTGETLTLSALLYTAGICWAVARAPWLELLSDTRRQHLLGGSWLLLCGLWLLRRDFESGLSFHFIGMTALTLLLDWPLAILVGFSAQLALCLLGRQEWLALGANGLLLVLLPVWLSEACSRWVERFQPRNLFVYIFACGFSAAGIVAVLSCLVGLGMLSLGGQLTIVEEWDNLLGYLWLVLFPEAFINGTLVTALVVFYPQWMETFNRTRYLQAPWRQD